MQGRNTAFGLYFERSRVFGLSSRFCDENGIFFQKFVVIGRCEKSKGLI